MTPQQEAAALRNFAPARPLALAHRAKKRRPAGLHHAPDGAFAARRGTAFAGAVVDAEIVAFVALFTFQTAHLVPAAHVCARVLHRCFTHPESRGGRSAEKRSGATAPVRHAMTRHARRLARRLASHDAGRSPLGAPPWRFWAPGPRFSPRHLRRIGYSELLAPRS
jgi:hypothetical protein